MNNLCVDCGLPSMGVRCRACNGKAIRRTAAEALSARDSALLASGIDGAALAERDGITRQAAFKRIRDARRRQALLRTEP